MKLKKLKNSILSLGLISIVMGQYFGIVYALEKDKKITKQIIEKEEEEEKEIKTEELISDKIINEGILDFKFKDYMKLIKSIKNGDDPFLYALINKKIFNMVKAIDNETYKTILNLVLNKGLFNINGQEEVAITKVLNIFLKDDKWFTLIKYASSLINKGINKIITKDSNALLDKILPLFNKLLDKDVDKINEIVNKSGNTSLNEILPFLHKLLDEFAEKLVKKFSYETEEQVNKRLENVKIYLHKVVRQFLIDGYNDKTNNDGVIEETALNQITNDAINLLYLVTSKEVIKEKIPVAGWKIRPIIRDMIYAIIEQLFQPSSGKIKKEINDLKKLIKNLKISITDGNSDIIQLNSDIKNLEYKIITINNKRTLTKIEYDELNSKIEKFKLKPYDFLMFKIGINDNDLKYVNDNKNSISEYEWFNKKYNSYWVLAKSLWHNYPNQNKKYKNEIDWDKAIKKSWEEGVKIIIPEWWQLWSKYEVGNYDETKKLIKESYGVDIYNLLEAKWEMIRDNNELIENNKEKKISSPSFVKGDYNKVLEYEVEKIVINNHNNNKILKQNNIKKIEKKIEDNKKNIKSSINTIKTLNNNFLYKYETINKITEKTLKANNLLKGKGLLHLSQKEIEYVLYKIKDLLLNINIYIDISIKKTLDSLSKRKTSFFDRAAFILIRIFFKGYVYEILNPIIKITLTEDLKKKITFVDSIKIANILYKIFSMGLKNIEANNVLYLADITRTFYKEFDSKVKLSDKDIINFYIFLKRGFNSLTKLNKIAIFNKIIELVDLPDNVKENIKKIIINSKTNVAISN